MIEVSIEVGSSAIRTEMAVRAESILQALSIARNRYPGDAVRVVFPIEPETFFVEDHTARARIARFEQPEMIVA
jgi:hypothetical protein